MRKMQLFMAGILLALTSIFAIPASGNGAGECAERCNRIHREAREQCRRLGRDAQRRCMREARERHRQCLANCRN